SRAESLRCAAAQAVRRARPPSPACAEAGCAPAASCRPSPRSCSPARAVRDRHAPAAKSTAKRPGIDSLFDASTPFHPREGSEAVDGRVFAPKGATSHAGGNLELAVVALQQNHAVIRESALPARAFVSV